VDSYCFLGGISPGGYIQRKTTDPCAANMLYVDQPVGVGFSFGTEDVNSTLDAAPDMWTFMQVFYDAFPEYKSREFGLFSESYGGHYGPVFAAHFQEQNAAIASGAIQGEPVNLVALGINNGWYDASIQYRSYMEYAFRNSYKPLINDTFYNQLVADFDAGCGSLLRSCANDTGNDEACNNADQACMQNFQNQIEQSGSWNPYDIRHQDSEEGPGGNWLNYLNNPDIQRKIGSNVTFATCSDSITNMFTLTGDGESCISGAQDFTDFSYRRALYPRFPLLGHPVQHYRSYLEWRCR
jgi:carboxypeptidase D